MENLLKLFETSKELEEVEVISINTGSLKNVILNTYFLDAEMKILRRANYQYRLEGVIFESAPGRYITYDQLDCPILFIKIAKKSLTFKEIGKYTAELRLSDHLTFVWSFAHGVSSSFISLVSRSSKGAFLGKKYEEHANKFKSDIKMHLKHKPDINGYVVSVFTSNISKRNIWISETDWNCLHILAKYQDTPKVYNSLCEKQK